MHVHLVQPGDKLPSLARRYRVTPGQLSLCNDLPPSSFLLPGQALCIPSQLDVSGTEGYSTYLVQAGDTPRSISETWRIPLTWLAFCNELHDHTLQPGEILLLPHTKEHVNVKPALRLLSLGTLNTMQRSTSQLTYRGMQQLRVDAAGHVHFPTQSVSSGEDRTEQEKKLLICTLDGASNILSDVARAILRSDHAQHRILDGLASGVRSNGGDGVIFAWHPLRAESEVAYLDFVREAERRLRPMGLAVGLHLTADSPLLKRRRSLEQVAEMIDHFFFDPVPRDAALNLDLDLIKKPPTPLVGLEETRRVLQTLSERIPLSKTWLILHPIGVVRKREKVLHRLSVKQAMHMAYVQGSPLCRDDASRLAWFRYTGGEGVCSVWVEDLWSLVGKLDLLHELRLQGLALWETHTDFPAAWNYVCEQYKVEGND